MGGHDGMDALLEFGCQYMDSPSGWDVMNALIPDGCTNEQTDIYVCLGVYIDKVARPLYIAMESTGEKSRDLWPCKYQAAFELALTGTGLTVDALEDLMTGGAAAVMTPVEATEITWSLVNIWLDYEHCRGRWHTIM